MAIVSGRDIALTGVPRGGTTLACHLLGTCPGTVALFEPMDVMGLPSAPMSRAVDEVAAFFARSRAGLTETGRAPSKHRSGQIPDNPFGARDARGRRVSLVETGWIEVEPRPTADLTLVVKHNAAFAALLPELAARIDTFAIVRNPVAVLASWHSVDLPVSGGRAPAGERLDAGLRRRLDAAPGIVGRQLILLDWFFGSFERHLPSASIIRYEDIVATDGQALAAAVGLPPGEARRLESRNANPLYDASGLAHALDALLGADGPWSRRYSSSELRAAADALMPDVR